MTRFRFLKPEKQKRFAMLLLGSLITAGLVTGAVQNTASASQERMNITLAGDAETSATKNLQARLTINAPPSFVWQTLTNYERLKNILPGYEKSNVLQSNGPVKTVDVAMKVTRLLPTYNYRVAVREDRNGYKLHMERVSGDFKALNATYRLEPVSGGSQTLLHYNLSINPGFTMPGTGSILRSNTEKTMAALRSHIETQHRQSVIGKR